MLYNRIALFRAERGISRKALAEAVGVNPQTIGYLERGDYSPSCELALKIAGRPFDDEEIGPVTWDVWMEKGRG